MRTSAEWFGEVKNSSEKLNSWLIRQYLGECRAAKQFLKHLPKVPEKYKKSWILIAEQEQTHADWVKNLLDVRNVDYSVAFSTEERYWSHVMVDDLHFHELAAAGHLAETMRLERITLLANDQEIDSDICDVFAKILIDEQWHARALEKMTTVFHISLMKPNHEKGMQALGLVM